MTTSLLRIGEIAARAGVSTRTVDYYTGLGLITPAARTGGAFRLYDPATVDRITTIRHLEALGIPLERIAASPAATPLAAAGTAAGAAAGTAAAAAGTAAAAGGAATAADAGVSDALPAMLARVEQDLHALRSTVDTAAPSANDLVVAAVTRAHDLITAALEILVTMQPGV